ncbi:hypothetical protein, partial [Megasphaera cerevisiae]|uniref:hypothetical protein n=1 Tax=Megasphaera cerevisiae TaxID=39029 RepID=UPI0015C5344C
MRPGLALGIAGLGSPKSDGPFLVFPGDIIYSTRNGQGVPCRDLAVFVAQVPVDGHVPAAADDAGVRRLHLIFRGLGLGLDNGVVVDLLAADRPQAGIVRFGFCIMGRDLGIQFVQFAAELGVPGRLLLAGCRRSGRGHGRDAQSRKDGVIPFVVGDLSAFGVGRVRLFSRIWFADDIIGRFVDFHGSGMVIGAVAAGEIGEFVFVEGLALFGMAGLVNADFIRIRHPVTADALGRKGVIFIIHSGSLKR